MSQLATIESSLSDAANALSAASESPRLDAEILLAWILDAARSYLFAHPEEALPHRQASTFSDAIKRREKGEPVAYITGSKEFWSMQLNVSRDTLVPRPETETLVEQALQRIAQDHACHVLDLGTGSGAIAIAIASERPNAAIVATDSSNAALTIARQNASLHKLRNITFIEGDWTEPVAEEIFDVVISNPPYVNEDDPGLDSLRYEPQAALTAGSDGLDAIRTIARDAKSVVKTNGWLVFEHGIEQQDAVADVLHQNGWTDIECIKDLAGHPRVTAARMSKPTSQDQT